jgi:hypothetical protein
MAAPTKPFVTKPRPPRKPALTDGDAGRREERLVALFILGCVLFSPLVLHVFKSVPAVIAGVPPLVLYLFGAWAALIAAVAVVVETGRRSASPADEAEEGSRPNTQGRRP